MPVHKSITIFAVPKAFKGHNGRIQVNAITSWKKLEPAPEILLLGDDPGVAEMASRYSLVHIPQLEKNRFGTPLVSDIFSKAQKAASHGVLAYVNADIILTSSFLKAVDRVRKSLDGFLMIGQRWDLDVVEPVDFTDPDWEEKILARAKNQKSHGSRAMDYFVFTKGVYTDMPAFALGRCAWDNWLAFHPLHKKLPVVDASLVADVIHQNHDYSHAPGGYNFIWNGPESKKNKALAGPAIASRGTTENATFVLGPDGLRQRSPGRLLQSQVDAMIREAGVLFSEKGDLAAAIQTVEEICSVLDRHDKQNDFLFPFCAKLFHASLEVFSSSAHLLEKTNKNLKLDALMTAIHAFKSLGLQIPPKNRDDGEPSVSASLKQGEDCFLKGRYGRAKEIFEDILKRHPDNVDAINNLAMTLWAMGDSKAAHEKLTAAYRKNETHKDVAYNLGQLCLFLKKPDQARQIYERFLEKDPGEARMKKSLEEMAGTGN